MCLFNSSHPKLREFREAVSAAAAAAVQQDEPNEEEDMMVDESQELAMGQVRYSRSYRRSFYLIMQYDPPPLLWSLTGHFVLIQSPGAHAQD